MTMYDDRRSFAAQKQQEPSYNQTQILRKDKPGGQMATQRPRWILVVFAAISLLIIVGGAIGAAAWRLGSDSDQQGARAEDTAVGADNPIQGIADLGGTTPVERVADPAAIAADEAAQEFADPDYAAGALDALDTTPEEVATSVVANSLGVDPQDPVVSETIVALGSALALPGTDGVASETEASERLASALVRRAELLGVDVDASGAKNELLGSLLAVVNPDGAITDADELQQKVLAFLADNPVNIVSLLPDAAAAASGLLSDSSYERAVAGLEVLALTGESIPIQLPAVAGVDAVNISNVRWETNDAQQTITFFGDATILGVSSEFSVALQWRGQAEPAVLASWHMQTWSLGEVGVTGPLGNFQIPQSTFVITNKPWDLTPAAATQSVVDFVSRYSPAAAQNFSASTGVSLISAVPVGALPESAGRFLSGSNSELPLAGSLGNTLAALVGGANDASSGPLQLSAPVPQLGAVFPSWMQVPANSPWELAIVKDAGLAQVTLGGIVDATLGDETKPFAMSIDLASTDAGNSATLSGELIEPWDQAFGLSWMNLDAAQLRVTIGDTAAGASLISTVSAFNSVADLTVAIEGAGERTNAELTLALDRVSISDAVEFVADSAGITSLTDLPALELQDVVLSLRAGDANSASIGATALAFGKSVDVHLGIVEKPDRSGYGTVFALNTDAVRLVDLVPAVAGTTADQLEFPATTLVLSNIDGTVPRSTMPATMQSYFASTPGAAQDLDLSSGLSLISSLDFDKVGLAEPMDAIGMAGLELPIVGTLPIDALSSGGAGGLDNLELYVQLPEFTPADGPEWFKSGQLSFFVSGQPAVGIEGRMTVEVDNTDLDFIVTAQMARAGGRVSMSLTGELAAQQPWVGPFDLDWLTFHEARLGVEVSPTGVSVGFGGRAVIAGKDIEGDLVLEISPAGVPTNFILNAKSAAGLSTNDLLAVASQMGGSAPSSAPNYPNLGLREIDLEIVPRESALADVEQGFRIAGDAHLTLAGEDRRLAELDVDIDRDGVTAYGRLGDGTAWELGPLVFHQVIIELELTAFNQRFAFKGSVELFGIPFEADIDLSTRSIFLVGQRALNEVDAMFDDFDIVLTDPAKLPLLLPGLYEGVGLPVPLWLQAVVDGYELLEEHKIETPDPLDLVLNGATIGLSEVPSGGADRDHCPVTSPIKIDNRCWTTPPIPSTGGVPSGGAPERCPVLSPQKHGGRCYSLKPDPCSGPLDLICDPNGTPNGGVGTVCGVETPFRAGGRCYTIAPTPAVGGLPAGGANFVCGPLAPFEEGGRCYTVTPSAAGVGLTIPGVCTSFGISCDPATLLKDTVARSLAEGLSERFDDWDS